MAPHELQRGHGKAESGEAVAGEPPSRGRLDGCGGVASVREGDAGSVTTVCALQGDRTRRPRDAERGGGGCLGAKGALEGDDRGQEAPVGVARAAAAPPRLEVPRRGVDVRDGDGLEASCEARAAAREEAPEEGLQQQGRLSLAAERTARQPPPRRGLDVDGGSAGAVGAAAQHARETGAEAGFEHCSDEALRGDRAPGEGAAPRALDSHRRAASITRREAGEERAVLALQLARGGGPALA